MRNDLPIIGLVKFDMTKSAAQLLYGPMLVKMTIMTIQMKISRKSKEAVDGGPAPQNTR